MKKFIACLLNVFGLGCTAQPSQKPQTIDPNTILFSVPTLSNDIGPLEPAERPKPNELSFHEDDWSQIEFLPKSQLATAQRMLKEFKPFEEKSRRQVGWQEIYLRKIERVPVFPDGTAIRNIEQILGVNAGPAPVLSSSGGYGRVIRGFTFPLGGNVTLYGFERDGTIPVFGAFAGDNANSEKLTQAFASLNSNFGMILVDWRSQFIFVSSGSGNKLDVWTP